MQIEYSNKIKELGELVDGWMQAQPVPENCSTVVWEACKYSLLAPGKRIRPSLVLASGEMLGIPSELLKSFALAVEYLHTFSLIHDDLPALDNDSMRRGQPSCHKKYNEAIALLAGDALMGLSFSLIASAVEVDSVVARRQMALLAQASVELCDGQMMDLEASGRGLSPKTLKKGAEVEGVLLDMRHMKKTGALIRAAVVGPALFVHGTEAETAERVLAQYGIQLGLLFQITDDILDATSSTEILGKDACSDLRQGTPTYVSVYGVERAKELARDFADQAVQALALFGEKAGLLAWFVEYVLTRTK